jgi:hypothetical protein
MPEDRRQWHLDKTFNISHILTTVAIAGSMFTYANNMDKRVAVLEERVNTQTEVAQRAQQDMKDLTGEVKFELRALRGEILELIKRRQP